MTQLNLFKYVILLASLLLVLLPGYSQALIIDHTCTDISNIPQTVSPQNIPTIGVMKRVTLPMRAVRIRQGSSGGSWPEWRDGTPPRQFSMSIETEPVMA